MEYVSMFIFGCTTTTATGEHLNINIDTDSIGTSCECTHSGWLAGYCATTGL